MSVLLASGIRYVRDGRAILDDVSLWAPPGAVTAVIGPSGSGKSSLLAILAGLEQPDAGTVTNPFEASRTALILQAYGLVSLLTASENVEMALQADAGLSRRRIRRRAAAALAEVGLEPVADHLTEALSGGQQQRVAIARALVVAPRLLIADEFTAELDPVSRGRVDGMVRGLARGGATVVIATHDPAIAAAADHVLDLGAPSA
ncbi:ABC transporter ATP-binding protein [Frondihabitans australicus]|uniref:Putative ABC transport system ATP-binding protein/tungstate transport system ATP-binding protein n=1 Tax=Frondihabitans australicus TaxID=386892 RepID=A0A495IDE4_9MICO|nr:ABC transporter ATP-binding protein [Frondihabitans australicus]RKR73992.1 putative ABC transport system ATP-binding protein/tungstate transport system ATP-binding protein [Frondihabitans australicus]